MASIIDNTTTRLSESTEESDGLQFPTRKHEFWRYVSVKELDAFRAKPLALSPNNQQTKVDYAENHSFFSANALTGEPPKGMTFTSTESLPKETTDFISKTNFEFNATNIPTLRIDAKAQLSHCISINPVEGSANWNRLHIDVGSCAEAELTLHILSSSPTATNLSLEISIHLEAGSQLKLNLLSTVNESSVLLQGLTAQLKRDSHLEVCNLGANTKLSRQRFSIDLIEENSEVKLTGCAVIHKEQQSHHFIEVNHLAPHCRSSQFFKNLLLDKGRASFDGTVYVKEGASGTEAHQLNNNLLLSDESRVYIKPRMKIKTSDVSCDHGATIGALEKDEIFYLVSRGLSELEAQKLLSIGFVCEALNACNHKEAKEWWLENHCKPSLSGI